MSFAQFVEGPLWYASAAIFVVGIVWHIVSVLRLGGRRDLSAPRAGAAAGAIAANIRHFFPSGTFMKRTTFHVVAGYTFHLALFALLLFGAPHVEFIKQHVLGFGWPAFPHGLFVFCAELAIAGWIMLYLRRLMDPVLRLISDADDHISSLLVFLVMLTGCMALIQGVTALRLIHMLTFEALLVYFPFSRLMHTFMFLFSRGYTGAVYGRRGETL